jgi:hypothetical protein
MSRGPLCACSTTALELWGQARARAREREREQREKSLLTERLLEHHARQLRQVLDRRLERGRELVAHRYDDDGGEAGGRSFIGGASSLSEGCRTCGREAIDRSAGGDGDEAAAMYKKRRDVCVCSGIRCASKA